MARLPDDCFIIYNPKGDACNFAEDIYKDLNRRTPGIFKLNPIEVRSFKNKEICPIIKDNVRRGHCFYIADSNQDPQYWFTEVAFVLHTLKNSSADEIVAVLPNLFYERQDRKDRPRVPISAKVIADVIGLYADRVLTLDVHSQQIQGFYDIPFDSLPSHKTLEEYLREFYPEIIEDKDLTISSPDVGGGKRVESFARRIGNPNVSIGHKVRIDNEGNKVGVEKVRYSQEQVKGRNVLLIDDIGDSFGTIYEACEELKENGAKKIYAYTTKAYFTKGYEILRKFEKLFIADIIKQPYIKKSKVPEDLENKLVEIPFARLFADAIYRTSIGESLSKLFR